MADKKKYSNTFILAFKNKHTEPPIGFHPVYIKQKRVQCTTTTGTNSSFIANGAPIVNTTCAPTTANTTANTTKSTTSVKAKGKWDNLEKIRAFASSDNSFIQRTRNRSSSEVLLGELRSLLNKVTDKTFETIMEKLAEIQYDQFDDDMIRQSVNVFLSKSISDKDYAELYSQIGCMFNINFASFKTLLTQECVSMCDKLFEGNSDIQKAKCLGLMRVLPYFTNEEILLVDVIQTNILNVVCQKIHERKHDNESYAQIAATGGCGLYIELLCKYCENLKKSKSDCDCDKYIELLTELKSIKTIPARMRFMVEDTLVVMQK